MAKLIQPDGTTQHVSPTSGGKFTLEELQGFVAGYIQIVPMVPRQTFDMLVNEEGLLLDLPLNAKASILAGQAIAGNALCLSREEWE
jgi:uncharacterized protein DUF3846